jgi:hypothetical protein
MRFPLIKIQVQQKTHKPPTIFVHGVIKMEKY